MKLTSTLLALCLVPTLVQASPFPGCYERDYGKAHLAENPQQGVAAIRMKISDPNDGYAVAVWTAVTMSAQGQAAADNVQGQVLEQAMFCPLDNPGKCFVECDGGILEVVSQTKDSLTVRTNYLRIGDLEGCSAVSDLAEPGADWTTYRLNAAPASVCADLGY